MNEVHIHITRIAVPVKPSAHHLLGDMIVLQQFLYVRLRLLAADINHLDIRDIVLIVAGRKRKIPEYPFHLLGILLSRMVQQHQAERTPAILFLVLRWHLSHQRIGDEQSQHQQHFSDSNFFHGSVHY